MSQEWSRSTRYFVFALVLASLIWFLIAAREMIAPLAISALLAYVLNPLVTFVNKRARVARPLVVFLVYLLSLTALVIVGIIFVPVIPAQTASFLDDMQAITTQAQEDYLSTPLVIFDNEIPLDPLVPDINGVMSTFVRPDLILGIVQTTMTNLGWIVVVLVTTYYLLQDWARLRDWLFSWAPAPFESDARRLYYEIKLVWNRYFRGQLRLSLIVGILTGLGSLIVGLPGAILFGVFAAVFDVLLSVGPAIIMVIAVLIALLAGSNTLAVSNGVFALIVLGIYGGIQAIENIWLRPRIMGSSLRIHPAIVFIAIVASLALAGILTALIIVPVLGSVAVLGRYLYFKLFKMDPWQDERISILEDATEQEEPNETQETAASATSTTSS